MSFKIRFVKIVSKIKITIQETPIQQNWKFKVKKVVQSGEETSVHSTVKINVTFMRHSYSVIPGTRTPSATLFYRNLNLVLGRSFFVLACAEPARVKIGVRSGGFAASSSDTHS